MDTEIEQLKQEVEELKTLTEDTNRQVHKMRRAVWWGRLWSIAWWLIIAGAGGAAYYYYAQPYVQKIEQYYTNFQHQTGLLQGWEQQAQQFFANSFGSSTTTKTN